MRVRVHEPGHHTAFVCVDPHGVLFDGHRISKSFSVANVNDASFECRDDTVADRRDLALRETATRRRAGAGRDDTGVFDEEVRANHAALG